jgi:uncharacterized protein (DUF305 family)
MNIFRSVIIAIVAFGLGWVAKSPLQNMMGEPMPAMSAAEHAAMGKQEGGLSTAGYKKAMDGMMAGMMTPYTGDADKDFIYGMIPHHQGAVDMAKVLLEFGKDPDVKKLAEGVVQAQESEIKWMNEWLTKNVPQQ